MGPFPVRRRLVLLGLLFLGTAARADVPADEAEFFEKKVRPVLAEHCFSCHSARAKKVKGGLLLDTRAGLLKGGDSGAVVVPGKPEQSKLLEAIGYKNVDLQMPPKGRLPEAAIADLTTWVKRGAPWPRQKQSGSTTAGTGTFDLEKRKREHWAWKAIRPVPPPAVRDGTWPLGPTDRFLLAALEEKGLTPAPSADRRTLIRRVSFDLIGLPPTPEEVEAFVHDLAPNAFERVVDRLLASPRFGERWGRHWLDLVRYAETRGHEFDYPLPNAYQYRDYVIRALNADVPYDQFVTEHLAGDLLKRPRRHPTEGFNESILGTGFWFLGEEVHSPVDVRQDQADRFDNKIDVLGKAFLGLTVACARCHDHKFDAISARDYYALYGILESSHYRLARFDSMETNRRVAEDLWRLREQARPVLQRALAEAARPTIERLADYLLAAGEAMQTASGDRPRWKKIAQARKLDAGLLERWILHLNEARKELNDPQHTFACGADGGRRQGEEETRRQGEEEKRRIENGRQRDAKADAARKSVEVVIDYAKMRPEDWLPEGVAFGPGPVRPGDVRLGTDPAHPVIRFCDRAAAENDPAFNGLRPAAGAENDPGALAGWVRAGRTLATPTFTLTSGKLFYLVRGAGHAYAAVDDHLMIEGPLHRALVNSFRAGNDWQWVSHDLTPYKGQLVHVEFTPADNADFAVAMVVQAANRPGSFERSNPLLGFLSGEEVASPEKLAAAYQRVFTGLIDRLASDRLRTDVNAEDYARLAAWMLRHPDLFGEKFSARLTEAARPLVEEQAKITSRIQVESRLALAIQDGTGVDEHVFIRGSPRTLGERVPRRFLEALAGPQPLPSARGSGRLALGRQMTDPALDPFLARVLVNRVWQHLFGRGIVGSVDNFGVLGEAPTHPELLDYLADRFVRDGWSIKRLLRSLVLSRAYQMASHPEEKADQADPQNLLLQRASVRRLEGEAIRDAFLMVSGRLEERMYGPSIPIHLTAFQDGRGRPPSGPLDGAGRRSIYLAVRRNFLSSFLLAFDTPSPFSTMGRRTVSNVPAQALLLMNDPFVHQQAERWAQRMLAEEKSAAERVAAMYRLAFSRPPSQSEVAACLDFLDHQARLRGGKSADAAVWTDLAHALFNAKEFIFLQ
jgi:cytochrome c553